MITNELAASRHFPALEGAGWCRSSQDRKRDDEYLMRPPSEEGVAEVHFKGMALPREEFESGLAVMRSVYSKYKLLVTTEVTDTALQTLYAPTIRGLAYQCEHYSQKYGVELFISTDGDIEDILKHFETAEGNAFGVILETTRKCNGHVTPAVFTRPNADSPWSVILLDTLGGKIQPIFEERHTYRNFKEGCLERPEIGDLFEYTGTRQYAFSGCRTDALVTLRNFLLYIRQNERFDPSSVVEVSKEPAANHHQFESYALALFHPSQSCVEVKGSEVQIKNRSSAQPKTLDAFRAQYVHPVHVRKTMQTTKGDKVKLVYERESERNVYLVYKGAQIVCNIARGYQTADMDTIRARVIGEVPEGF